MPSVSRSISPVGIDLDNGITFGPRQNDFIYSNDRYPLLYGSVRAGKTYALCRRALRLAHKFPGNKGLLARETLGESEDTLLVSWRHVVPERMYRISRVQTGGWDIAVMSQGPQPSMIHVRSLRDLDRIKGMELGFFGISQLDDRGITRSLWDWATSRFTWTLPKGYGNKKVRPDGKVVWEPDYTGFAEANSGKQWIIDLWGPKRVHGMPGYKAVEVSLYDNKSNLPEDTIRDLESKPEYWKRWFLYPCWEPIGELEGTPVFNGHFDFRLHVSDDPVVPETGWPIIRGWDVPGPVGTVWFQLDRENRCRVLYEQLADMGESLQDIKQLTLSVSRQLFPDFDFLDISDPAGINTESPTDKKTCADILRPEIQLLPGETTISGRLEAGRSWLDRLVHTKPAVVIDPRCRILIGGLANSYVWKQVAGRDLPEPKKNSASHIIDAWLGALARVTHLSPRNQRSILGPKDFGPPS